MARGVLGIEVVDVSYRTRLPSEAQRAENNLDGTLDGIASLSASWQSEGEKRRPFDRCLSGNDSERFAAVLLRSDFCSIFAYCTAAASPHAVATQPRFAHRRAVIWCALQRQVREPPLNSISPRQDDAFRPGASSFAQVTWDGQSRSLRRAS